MKQRVRADVTLMLFAIALTGFIYFTPLVRTNSVIWNNALDWIGLMSILKGTYLRMAARGYKKAFSQKGHDLVVDGLYTLTRNPMYLGTYLIGAGFTLILLPWWFLAVFSAIFFLRFNKQMVQEETHLKGLFGEKYERYCRTTPRFFPSLKRSITLKVAEVFPWETCWSTKERWGLLAWPALALVLVVIQEYAIYQAIDILRVLSVFVSAILVFGLALFFHYR